MQQVPLVAANVATVFMESFLYGIFFVLSVSSIYLLVHRQRQLLQPTLPHLATASVVFMHLCKTPMFLGAIALSVTITAHWILTCIRTFQAFVYFEGGTDPIAFYGNLKQLTEVVKTGFLMASLIIGDTMVIYRLWVVWNRRTAIVIFPLCTLAGLTVCGIGITYQFTQYYPGENVFVSQAGRWITSDCVFTLCTNVYSTAMIGYRVWTSRHVKLYSGTNLVNVLTTFIESAALYTAWTTFFFISYQANSNLQFTAVDTWSELSGISFMLINVRVGLGWAQTGSRIQYDSHAGSNRTTNRTDESSGGSYQMRPLAVKITSVVDHDDDLKAKCAESDGGSFIPSSQ
ncbi:uncharacterized protein C8Q71DRAFT_743055 [Rhodofomes roseus]|uniref:Uncharacterized protein n=1 Tax=Rhodofomes roseus TaxID=34475 RepID=A0A4Y9Z2V4_9APHY|nr:uncharacterized protein C8Q71DRAFT_743055 [Rhodofomes roseus]KAH9841057.1 hypothetical protein C8Q71DRAFT_743055 [Rhodofomes roseus]TFY68317.1 hypothetical protein EVJ58_g1098 [Rhodofomes roseus]